MIYGTGYYKITTKQNDVANMFGFNKMFVHRKVGFIEFNPPKEVDNNGTESPGVSKR